MNQGHYCGDAPKTIVEYIEAQDELAQPLLWQLHQCIDAYIPEEEQRIAWSMPCYGKPEIKVQYSACKSHVSLYVGEAVIGQFAEELKGIVCKKSAVYLPYAKELPMEILKRIIAQSAQQPST